MHEKTTTYYDRAMDPDFVGAIQKDYPWLIDYVRKNEELDFQTGHDPRSERSWFSIYRGTGRLLTFVSRKKGEKKYKIEAADAYKRIAPMGFFDKPTEQCFKKYLTSIKEASNLNRYYETEKGKKEGYYQNLIARRYTFKTTQNDELIVIDKEVVIGFKDRKIKKCWNKDIVESQNLLIDKLRHKYKDKGRLPKNIVPEYGEYDFLAITWNGDLVIMELKQDDSAKTALSPIQVRYYYEQLKKLVDENKQLFGNIIKMVKQKVELGIITIPEGKSLPSKLSGEIRTCVIVGDDESLSKTICERFRLAREIFLPDMEAYTCESDGTLKESNKLS